MWFNDQISLENALLTRVECQREREVSWRSEWIVQRGNRALNCQLATDSILAEIWAVSSSPLYLKMWRAQKVKCSCHEGKKRKQIFCSLHRQNGVIMRSGVVSSRLDHELTVLKVKQIKTSCLWVNVIKMLCKIVMVLEGTGLMFSSLNSIRIALLSTVQLSALIYK